MPMTQQILRGVDMDLSTATQTMLQVVRSLLQELAPQDQVLPLIVIPLFVVVSRKPAQ